MSEDIFNMREDKMLSYIIFTFANSCMPTLFKHKPSSLVTFQKRYIEKEEIFFRTLVAEAARFSCCCELLHENEKVLYVLVYQPELLEEILKKYGNNPLLKNHGYKIQERLLSFNLKVFQARFQKYKREAEFDFPHEVGIFLGYPIEDVEEYVKNNGENYLLCGYWKVYHNVEEALLTFAYFKRIREEAIQLFFSGEELSCV
ncbi:hypothetical protein acsn021_31330 [Anaerocolumna cellulosilytica]|uniref:Uncharacterized protein n=1 Tax=Anaerocolumna cellulosilytica TaxID=433286 RepID=A0A6S6QY53_9FIRM|nr:DUF3793 family protein [Anaerocolumna cellulosilytica]MBB5197887.1 hypothetical protein [Anaerocolumna cellulosilytica]BCJ95564.1 hypothetical protein acsn021_31330 [Anaerocolumna cellulosilytica]